MSKISETITETEYDSLNKYQGTFYLTENKDDAIRMRYQQPIPKYGWNTNQEKALEVEEKKDSKDPKYYYYVDKKYDYFKSVTLRCISPEIKVDSAYVNTVQIRWSKNLLHHVHGACVFSTGSGASQTITPLYLDDVVQTLVHNKNQYLEQIGNKPNLRSWTNHLQSDVLSMEAPWFFSLHDSTAFPLYEPALENEKVHFECDFQLNISKLVEMRGKKKGTDEWGPIQFSLNYLDEESQTKFETPQLWGHYSNISKDEKNARLKNPRNGRLNYIDVIEISTHAIKKYGQTIPVNLQAKEPVVGISWKAVNEKCEEYNQLSNYTTDRSDPKKGYNPITHSEIKYGNVPRVSKREHDHFDTILPRRYFGQYPFEKGYNFYFFDDKPRGLVIGNSLIFDRISKNCTLSCTLGDPSKINERKTNKKKLSPNGKKIVLYPSSQEKDDNSPEFKVKTLLYVAKTILFSQNKVFHISDDMSLKNYTDRNLS